MKNPYVPLEFMHIFPKEIKLKVRILTSLFQSDPNLQIGDLIKISNLDRKTVYKYIKEINEISIRQFGKEIILLNNKKQYYFGMSKPEFLTLRFLIFETTFTIELINSFIKNSTVGLVNFCLENFISENALKQQVKALNSLLNSFNITIKTNKGFLYLEGNENKIRYFLSTFFWRVYRGFKWPFRQLEKSKLKETLKSICPNSMFDMGNQEVPLYLLAISILRVKAKNYIEDKGLPTYAKVFYDSFPKQSIRSIVNSYHLPIYEVKFIVLFLHIFPQYILSKNKNHEILNQLSLYQKDSYLSIINFLEFVKQKNEHFEASSPKGQNFLSILISARIFVDIFYDTYFNIYDLNLIYHSQQEFPNLLPSIENCLIKCNSKISDKELKSLVFRYTQAYISTFPPQDFEPLIKILLITDTPVYIETLLKNRIKSVLSEKFNFSISTSFKSNNFDFIIATGKLEKPLLNNKILYVYPHLPIKDISNLISLCEDLSVKK